MVIFDWINIFLLITFSSLFLTIRSMGDKTFGNVSFELPRPVVNLGVNLRKPVGGVILLFPGGVRQYQI